jgi:hypothetical protein
MSETLYRMTRVAPTDVVQDIVRDLRSGPAQPSSIAAPPTDRAAPAKGTGWVDAKPLGKQPGIDLIDQMVERQTAKERLQAAQEQMRAAIERQKYEELMREKRERERKD